MPPRFSSRSRNGSRERRRHEESWLPPPGIGWPRSVWRGAPPPATGLELFTQGNVTGFDFAIRSNSAATVALSMRPSATPIVSS